MNMAYYFRAMISRALKNSCAQMDLKYKLLYRFTVK